MSLGAGVLTVTFHKAERLYHATLVSKQDPYVRFGIDELKFRSNVAHDGGQNPVWEYSNAMELAYDESKADPILQVEVLHQGAVGDDVLGSYQVSVKELISKPAPVWYPLYRDLGKVKHGNILISCVWKTKKELESDRTPAYAPFDMSSVQSSLPPLPPMPSEAESHSRKSSLNSSPLPPLPRPYSGSNPPLPMRPDSPNARSGSPNLPYSRPFSGSNPPLPMRPDSPNARSGSPSMPLPLRPDSPNYRPGSPGRDGRTGSPVHFSRPAGLSSPNLVFVPNSANSAQPVHLAMASIKGDVLESVRNGQIKFVVIQTQTGRYVAPQADSSIKAVSEKVGDSESWHIEFLGFERHRGYQYAFQSIYGKYLCAEESGVLIANRNQIGPWETFTIIPQANGSYSIQGAHKLYLSLQVSGSILCNAGHVGANQCFQITEKR